MNFNGILNEDKIVFVLNNKKFSDIPPHFQVIFEKIFGPINGEEIITSNKVLGYMKPDICVTIRNETKYLSIKRTNGQVVHGEEIRPFLTFLYSIGVSKSTLKTLLLYHYGDGTMDGTGTKRKTSYESYIWLEDKIKIANEELNRPIISDKILERMLFKGSKTENIEADYIYMGNEDYGYVVSKRQIHRYLSVKKFDFIDMPHVGPVLIKSHARYVDGPIVSEQRHNEIQCHWPNMYSDFEYINKKFKL